MQKNPNLTRSPRATAFPSPVVVNHMRAVVAAAGGDPASVPEMPYCFLRPAKVAELLGVHITTVYRMVGDGTLPKPIDVGRGLPLKSAAAARAA